MKQPPPPGPIGGLSKKGGNGSAHELNVEWKKARNTEKRRRRKGRGGMEHGERRKERRRREKDDEEEEQRDPMMH